MDAAFSVNRHDGQTILEVEGEVDLANAGALRAAIESLAAVPEDGQLVVDLRAMTFIDSTGLHALVSGARSLDRKVVLRDPSGPTRRVLDIALPGYFTIECTGDEPNEAFEPR